MPPLRLIYFNPKPNPIIMEKLFRGIVLLDKPAGHTSLECAERIRKVYGAKKAGHAGTLDPGATGVLLIALDEATKAMPVLMGLEKEYEGIMHIHKDFRRSEIQDAAKSFTGRITQKPPVKSAVSRAPRERDIYYFEITGIQGRDVSFRIRCQAGTYIRKICSDMGERMDTHSHMKSLRRTGSGPFQIKECATFEMIKENPSVFLMPIERALERAGLKRIDVKGTSVPRIIHGSPVKLSDAEGVGKGICAGDVIGIYSKDKIIALAVSCTEDGKSGTLAKTQRVFSS
jgi:H/ACA ribonucleoprotein complex subunit 4